MKTSFIFLLSLALAGSVRAQIQTTTQKKINFLIHITQGPENPTRAALAFLVAKSAIEEGHNVTLFLAPSPIYLRILISRLVLPSPEGEGICGCLIAWQGPFRQMGPARNAQ